MNRLIHTSIPFHCFRRVEDGIWTCTRSASFTHDGYHLQVSTGQLFRVGENYMGVDLVVSLEHERARQHELLNEQLERKKQVRSTRHSPPRRADSRPDNLKS